MQFAQGHTANKVAEPRLKLRSPESSDLSVYLSL